MAKNIFSKIKKSLRFDEEFFDDEDEVSVNPIYQKNQPPAVVTGAEEASKTIWPQNDDTYGELSVDVYQTDNDIIIQTMIAGTRPEDLDITISRDMVNIKGKREDKRSVDDSDFFIKELYWGSFARTIALPHEIDIDLVDAVEKHGLLTLRLPKIDKSKQAVIKVKSI